MTSLLRVRRAHVQRRAERRSHVRLGFSAPLAPADHLVRDIPRRVTSRSGSSTALVLRSAPRRPCLRSTRSAPGRGEVRRRFCTGRPTTVETGACARHGPATGTGRLSHSEEPDSFYVPPRSSLYGLFAPRTAADCRRLIARPLGRNPTHPGSSDRTVVREVGVRPAARAQRGRTGRSCSHCTAGAAARAFPAVGEVPRSWAGDAGPRAAGHGVSVATRPRRARSASCSSSRAHRRPGACAIGILRRFAALRTLLVYGLAPRPYRDRLEPDDDISRIPGLRAKDRGLRRPP